jgi:hypothetical protein
VTLVVEQEAMPLPGAPVDPRRQAIATTVEELRRLGVPDSKQTILVACGLARRPRRKELASLVSARFARTFHGEVVVHDVEDEGLVELGESNGVPLRASRALVETDAVVTISAAETVLHGGPAALLAAGARRGAAIGRRGVAAADERLERLAARARDGARPRRPRAADRTVADARPAARR